MIDPFTASPHDRLRVLDLGPASSATIRFFGQFRCTLHICALHPSELPLPERIDGGVDSELLDAHFSALLDLPPGSQFDVRLYWGLINHLDDDGVTAFSRVVRPHFHRATRGHGFAVLNNRVNQGPWPAVPAPQLQRSSSQSTESQRQRREPGAEPSP